MTMCCFVAIWFNAAHGATLYYSSSSSANTEIYSINSTTGGDALLTTVSGVQYLGLAPSSIPNTIFAIDTTSSTGCLNTFNVANLATNLVGCAGLDIREIAFNAITRTLYGTDYSNLYAINTSTGAATLIGSFGGGLGAMWSLGYDSEAGILYGLDVGTSSPYPASLYTVNTSTGAAALVGATGQNRITDNFIDPGTGNMFGVGNGPNNFYSINKATGAAVVVSAITGTAAVGLAAPVASAPAAIPAMSEWGVILLSILLAVGAVFALRCRDQ